MQKQRISDGWYRLLDGEKDWKKLDLPDDYAVSRPRDPKAPGGAANGFFVGGRARYVRYLRPEKAAHLILDVDGAYCNAEVTLNGNQLAEHPHGYTPFLVDLTDTVRFGACNKLEIVTDDMQPSTRWYSGAGLYRDVFLWTGGDVRVEPWDVFVKTVQADTNQAVVEIRYLIASDRTGQAQVRTEIEGTAPVTDTVAVRAGEKTPLTVTLTVENPALWCPENPHLYRLGTTVTADGAVTDTAETAFGIRTVSADAVHGFRLNGKTMKLRGGCIHHDHGILGAASFPAAEERKVRLLQQAGFNALRVAHNPPSLALMEVCDRLGMLLLDEAFDMWNVCKTPHDYHLFFRDWWDRDIAAMVLRDRNHPSVITYSIGNEIQERDGFSDGAAWSARLTSEIRKYDDTRLVTSGICGLWYTPSPTDPADYDDPRKMGRDDAESHEIWLKRSEAYMAPLDIVGYNYLYPFYEPDHRKYPARVMWGSETHALDFYDSWSEVKRLPYVLGDFTWTAYDNLGEAGTGRSCWARDGFIPGISLADWPWRTCYQGDLDLCGYRRPQSYFREAVWIGGKAPAIFTTHPEHYGEGFSGTHWHWYDVLDTWTFDDAYLGKPVKADVYTDAEEVEWFVNGRSLGTSKPEKGIATFTVPYEKGTLSVIARKGGVACGEASLHTVGAPARVEVTRERAEFTADNRDLCYFRVTVLDENGNRVPHAANALTCLVDGGELMGIFSGDPANEDDYTSNQCHAFQGRALVIVRTKTPGKVTVTVGAPGLTTGHDTAEAR